MRINKYIGASGICSRRRADQLIDEGKVKVNGQVLMEKGYDVRPGDEIQVDGTLIRPETRKLYYLVNKPVGYVTTVSDPQGRPTVMELVPDVEERLFPVGRLDVNTSGLLIITNDGDLANRLTHPSHEMGKTYVARVTGMLTMKEAKSLEKGVRLEEFTTSPAQVRLIRHDRNSTLVEITIHEGKNRQVRRMMEAVGHPVTDLERTAIGTINSRLPVGGCRKLNPGEIDYLKGIK